MNVFYIPLSISELTSFTIKQDDSSAALQMCSLRVYPVIPTIVLKTETAF